LKPTKCCGYPDVNTEGKENQRQHGVLPVLFLSSSAISKSCC